MCRADVVHDEVHHDAMRISADPAHAVVDAHAEPDAGPVEVDEVRLGRARREPEAVAVELGHCLESRGLGPDEHARQPADPATLHSVPPRSRDVRHSL